jgi:hypothetical protein
MRAPGSLAQGGGEAVLLEREACAKPIPVPRTMTDLAPDLQRLSARLRACGLEDPFREEALKAIPPAAIRGALAEARGRGVLDEGPGWAQHGHLLPDLAETLRRTFQHQMDLDRSFPNGPERGL